MIVRELINQAINKLKTKSTSPSLDAEVLLAFVWKKSKEYLAANFTEPVPKRIKKQFQKLIAKRANNWPVAYLTGEKDFYGLKFKVNKHVLIPRPVTEQLVDWVLERTPRSAKIVDIGTGSGCIIISLAKNSHGHKLFASDISAQALAVAKLNARTHHAKITFKQGSLLQPWQNQDFDIIIANLPYLARRTDPSTKFEPTTALVARKKGLALIEKLFEQIKEPRLIFLEIGETQGPAIKKLAGQLLPAYQVRIVRDLSHRDRYCILEK